MGVYLGLLQAVSESKLYTIVAAILLLLLATRLISAILGRSKRTLKGYTVPTLPYWLPIIGHAPQFFLQKDSFFKWARAMNPKGAFALNMFGSTHNIIFRPSFGQTLMNQSNDVANAEKVSKYIMTAVFGWPKSEWDVYDQALPELHGAYSHLSSHPGLPTMINKTIDELQKTINNLVTFSHSPVDQTWWERESNVKPVVLADGEQAEEVDLFTLVRDFSVLTSNLAVFGSDFQNNNPQVLGDLWQMDRALLLLATGMPSYAPIPGLSSGHAARKRLFTAMEEWETAMDKHTKGEDPGSKWSNLDDVSGLLKARIPIYQKHNLSLRARASAELGVLWAANANAHPLVFWIVARVFGDASLLAQIRAEVQPYLRIQHPKQDFPLPEPPRLEHVDHDGLTDKCPLLKAAYIESLRLDVSGWSFKIMQQDLTLRSREKGETPDEFVVQKGTYCHVAHELHHTDPRAFPDPLKWDVQRHLKPDPDHPGVMKADMGTVRPYGGGGHMCKGRQFALKEILLFVAAIVTFWDIEPVPGKKWTLPKPRQTPGTKHVQDQMRVLVKRRKLPAE